MNSVPASVPVLRWAAPRARLPQADLETRRSSTSVNSETQRLKDAEMAAPKIKNEKVLLRSLSLHCTPRLALLLFFLFV